MKVKIKGLKLQFESFEISDTEKEDIKQGYKTALHQIGAIISKEQNIEKIKEEIKLLLEYPKI